MKAQFIILSVLISTASVFSQERPLDLLERIESAFQFMEEPLENCQVILHSDFFMSNPNGKKPFSSSVVTRLTSQGGDRWEEEILEQSQEGDGMEEEASDSSVDEEEEEQNFSMILPMGEDIDKFRFEAIGSNRWRFSPLSEYSKEKGITAGEIHFDQNTGQTILIADYVKPPSMVSEMHLEFTLGVWEDYPVPIRMEMTGEGGILMIRKIFSSTLVWKDYQPIGL